MRKPPLDMTRTCAVCGKEILLTPGWLYKRKGSKTRRTEHYCSWSCMREAEQRRKIEKATAWIKDDRERLSGKQEDT